MTRLSRHFSCMEWLSRGEPSAAVSLPGCFLMTSHNVTLASWQPSQDVCRCCWRCPTLSTSWLFFNLTEGYLCVAPQASLVTGICLPQPQAQLSDKFPQPLRPQQPPTMLTMPPPPRLAMFQAHTPWAALQEANRLPCHWVAPQCTGINIHSALLPQVLLTFLPIGQMEKKKFAEGGKFAEREGKGGCVHHATSKFKIVGQNSGCCSA